MPVLQKSLKQKNRLNVLIYGKEGSGKSNLAKSFPSPLVMRCENGIFDENIPYLDGSSYADFYGDLQNLAACDSISAWLNEQGYNLDYEIKTLVVDSSTALENFMNTAFCQEKGITELQDLGGKKMGGAYVWREAIKPWWRTFTEALDVIGDKHNINIVITAHNKLASIKSSQSEAYNKEDLSLLNPHAASVLKEWADINAFLYNKVVVRNVGDQMNKTNIATGVGGRVIGLTENPAYYAKIRDFGGKIQTDGVDEIPYEKNCESFFNLVWNVLSK